VFGVLARILDCSGIFRPGEAPTRACRCVGERERDGAVKEVEGVAGEPLQGVRISNWSVVPGLRWSVMDGERPVCR